MQGVDFVMFHFKFKLNFFNCENEETSRVLLQAKFKISFRYLARKIRWISIYCNGIASYYLVNTVVHI
jgi:hypothetical protein